MIKILTKAVGLWLLLVAAAMINGVIRENLTAGTWYKAALPVSGVLLSLLIFMATYILIPQIGKTTGYMYGVIGAIWVLLTLSFEFLFGHYGLGKSFQEIMAVFNVMGGNLFILALMTSAVSPWFAAKTRGYL